MNVIIRDNCGNKYVVNVPYAKPSDLPASENRKITLGNNDKIAKSINNLSYLARHFNHV